jgi:UDP-glucose 4-epimerase
MRIVITGASGFIGGRLLEQARLVYGKDIVAFSSHPTAAPHIAYKSVGDFCLTSADLELVEKAEVLIHAGAYTPKSAAQADSIEGCNGNIKFTENLLSLPWQCLRKIIFLSSLDVYADTQDILDEHSVTGPTNLYGLSKLYCERMLEIYARERRITSQILRIGHVYGPGEEKYSKLIPKTIQNIVGARDVELWGSGAEKRSFIFIDDAVLAILKAAETENLPGVINIVGGKAISVLDLIEKLIAIGGQHTSITRRGSAFGGRDFVFNNKCLRQHLLTEETDLAVGLKAEFVHIQNLQKSSG